MNQSETIKPTHMHKFKFRFGDKVIIETGGRTYKAVYVKLDGQGSCYVVRKGLKFTQNANVAWLTPDYAGTFTHRKARGGFRYNVVGLNNQPITTSEVLAAKQSATEMHERHYRNYKLVDKTVKG